MSYTLSNFLAVGLYRILMSFLYGLFRTAGLFYSSEGLNERFGYYPENELKKMFEEPRVWLHAASAGEVKAITPFCAAFRKARPQVQIILTVTSRTGKKLAQEIGVADFVFFAPLDMGPCVKRAFTAFKPMVYLVAETEFWPRILLFAAQSKIPTLLLNGRISDKSFPLYSRFKSLFAPALNGFNHCFVQSMDDLEKMKSLGMAEDKVSVVGQLKYDLSPPDSMTVQKFKETLSLLRKDILFTFGSIRTEEDDLLMSIIPDLLKLSPDVKILLAPRHLKNVQVVQDKLRKIGMASTLRSRMDIQTTPERVILLDTMGELVQSYAFSRAAFVGGTLVPIGGHNLMEPALAAVPVCFGPYTNNLPEAAEALVRSGGGFQVQDVTQLLECFKRFLDEDFAKQAGRKAHESVLSMRGATEKTVQGVLNRWPSEP
jgi:3-deoxy-D-manno-octulosonic-acid transferase